MDGDVVRIDQSMLHVWLGEHQAHLEVHQRFINWMWRDLLDTEHARKVPGQKGPFIPITIFGWTP